MDLMREQKPGRGSGVQGCPSSYSSSTPVNHCKPLPLSRKLLSVVAGSFYFISAISPWPLWPDSRSITSCFLLLVMPMWAELCSVGGHSQKSDLLFFFFYTSVFLSLCSLLGSFWMFTVDLRLFLMNFEDPFHQWRHLFVTR